MDWDRLSMAEKADIMRLAVQSGIYNLDTIREEYNKFAEGGGIHIKHPGRLTALKKRTGKTEAELYSDGNPAHKKMVVFARNARKWKHALGGPVQEGDDYPESYWENRREHPEVRPRYKRTKKDDEYWEEKNRRNMQAAEELNRRKGVVMSALSDTANSVPVTGSEITEAAEAQRQEKLDKAHELKMGLDATMTAAELLAAGYGVTRGLTHLNRYMARQATQSTGQAISRDAMSNLAKWNRRVATIDKPQVLMNGIGGTADAYQWYTADNNFDAWENGLETGANTAGVVGGMNWFRNLPYLRRIGGDKIDAVLDGLGYGAAGWDVVKNIPPLSWALDNIRTQSKENKALGGNLFSGEENHSNRMVTTGGAGYIPPVQSGDAIDDVLSTVSKKAMNYIKGAHDTGSYFSYDSSMEPYAGPAQDTYLLPRRIQEKEFLKRGYTKGRDKDYGLVSRAVGDRNLPVYQRNPDAISRDNLTAIGNVYGWDPWYGDSNTSLEHAGSYPTAVYTDGEGNFYQKGWDLNDYGGKTGSTVGILSDIVDRIGSPTVVTTGYQPVKDSQSERFIQEITPMMANKGLVPTDVNGRIEWTLPEVTVTSRKRKRRNK